MGIRLCMCIVLLLISSFVLIESRNTVIANPIIKETVTSTCGEGCLRGIDISAIVLNSTSIQYRFSGRPSTCDVSHFLLDLPLCLSIIDVTGCIEEIDPSIGPCGSHFGSVTNPFKIDIKGNECDIILRFNDSVLFGEGPMKLKDGGGRMETCSNCTSIVPLACGCTSIENCAEKNNARFSKSIPHRQALDRFPGCHSHLRVPLRFWFSRECCRTTDCCDRFCTGRAVRCGGLTGRAGRS